MAYQFETMDVFTTETFKGNPLAVVLDADDLTPERMQIIAREFNLSETIFVQKPEDTAHTAKVRIFFPTAEIPFAGHPTIGCAILLAENMHPSGDFQTLITLEEQAGLVPVQVKRLSSAITAQFTAPKIPVELKVAMPGLGRVAAAFGLQAVDIGFEGHQPSAFNGGPDFVFIPVASREVLKRAHHGAEGWRALCNQIGLHAFYLYTKTETGFAARMFAPDDGIPEDPATGSASAMLAGPLLKAGELKEGCNVFSLVQGQDMGRRSDIGVEIDVRNNQVKAIRVSGSAVRVMRGEIRLT